MSNGADDGIRTRDLRFTKPLLYQLSYVGAPSREDYIARRLTQAKAVVGTGCSDRVVMRLLPEQPFQGRAECPAAFSFAGPSHEDRAIGSIDDAPGQIAHDIMP